MAPNTLAPLRSVGARPMSAISAARPALSPACPREPVMPPLKISAPGCRTAASGRRRDADARASPPPSSRNTVTPAGPPPSATGRFFPAVGELSRLQEHDVRARLARVGRGPPRAPRCSPGEGHCGCAKTTSVCRSDAAASALCAGHRFGARAIVPGALSYAHTTRRPKTAAPSHTAVSTQIQTWCPRRSGVAGQ